MGVTKLKKIIPIENIEITALTRKTIAIDAYNHLYQFLSSIRQRDGTELKDEKGRITSHLSGLFYRTLKLELENIKSIYVFDGKPSELKEGEIKERKIKREEAKIKFEEAKKEGDYAEARKYAQAALFLTPEMVKEAKMLLTAMGVPHVQARSEGEAQAAYLVQTKDAWASGSQDWDSILFGSPRFVRNLNFSGKRRIRGREVDIKLELVNSKKVFEELALTREQLIDVGIMLGTDYNDGFPKVGPATALKLIRKYGDLESILKKENYELDLPLEEIRAIFLTPEIETDYKIKFGNINEEKIKSILCDRHSFNLERVTRALKKVVKKKQQQSLIDWM